MPVGKGKYDSALSDALDKCEAMQGVLIVIDGKDGPGFCAKMTSTVHKGLPEILRTIAIEIEQEYHGDSTK